MGQLVRNAKGRVVSGALNPGGRPKLPSELRAMAQAASPLALAKVIEHLGHEDARVSLRAAEILLDRGYGKPVAEVEERGAQQLSIAEEHLRVLQHFANVARQERAEAGDRARIVDAQADTGDAGS